MWSNEHFRSLHLAALELRVQLMLRRLWLHLQQRRSHQEISKKSSIQLHRIDSTATPYDIFIILLVAMCILLPLVHHVLVFLLLVAWSHRVLVLIHWSLWFNWVSTWTLYLFNDQLQGHCWLSLLEEGLWGYLSDLQVRILVSEHLLKLLLLWYEVDENLLASTHTLLLDVSILLVLMHLSLLWLINYVLYRHILLFEFLLSWNIRSFNLFWLGLDIRSLPLSASSFVYNLYYLLLLNHFCFFLVLSIIHLCLFSEFLIGQLW
jgi:hypothetical protein